MRSLPFFQTCLASFHRCYRSTATLRPLVNPSIRDVHVANRIHAFRRHPMGGAN